MEAAVLEARGVGKTFGSTRALSQVDLSLRPGEIHALAGENGSGKSTLMRIIAGAHQPDEGWLCLAGQRVTFRGVVDARAHGIALVAQEGSILPDLEVAENVLVGARRGRPWRVDRRACRRDAEEALAQVGVTLDVRRPAGSLRRDEQQLVEIARALAVRARVLMLDEPTSSLDGAETAALFAALRRLRAAGAAIVFVSHRLEEMLDLADRVTVLRDGRVVDSAPRAEVDAGWLVSRMVGRDAPPRPTDRRPPGEVVLRVDGLHDLGGRVRGASLTVRAGEVVGLAGLVGAGRTELLECVVGARPRRSGSVEVAGRPVAPHPWAALRAGIGFVSEDRRASGSVLGLSVRDNALLTHGPHRLRPRDRGHERRAASGWVTRLGVRPASVEVPMRALSGGNQQKVLLARALQSAPRVLLLDEPTRGIDIGAKRDLHRMIEQLAAEGTAVVVASTELAELLAVSDRVLVLHGGAIVTELAGEELTEERVVAAATGALDAVG